MQRTLLLLIITILQFNVSGAQDIDSLGQLKNYSFKMYYSAAYRQRAELIATRIEKALSYNQQLLDFKPVIEVFLIDSSDWKKYTNQPVIYGMPHYVNENKRLVLAATDNPFWKDFIPPLNELPENLKESVQKTYTNSQGKLSMEAFFDLLAIHELGHAFHHQGGLTMQRSWMGELFVNILLHNYVAENEKESLPALTLFPQMVVAEGSKQFIYTKLRDVQERYNEIGQRYPANYGWYQCRWHIAAARIYDSSGKQVCRKLWDALKIKELFMSDEKFAIYLDEKADKSIGNMIRNWDSDTIR